MGFSRAKQVWGAVVVLAGIGLSLLILRRLVFGQIADIWHGGLLITLWTLGFLLLNVALAAYLLYAGFRMVNPQTVRPSRVGWGKVIVGAWILCMQVGLDYHLVPEGPLPIHRPSNPTQAASVLVFDLIGVYLIFRGIWAGFSRREPQPNILPWQSPPSGR